jgi:hypothetical protein
MRRLTRENLVITGGSAMQRQIFMERGVAGYAERACIRHAGGVGSVNNGACAADDYETYTG